MGLTNGAILDDLKTNFRKWEFDSDNQKDTNRLATILMSRHGVSFDEAYKYAKHWTGYDYEDNKMNSFYLLGLIHKHIWKRIGLKMKPFIIQMNRVHISFQKIEFNIFF